MAELAAAGHAVRGRYKLQRGRIARVSVVGE